MLLSIPEKRMCSKPVEPVPARCEEDHERETEVMVAAARAVAGEAGVDTATQPVTGGEDFAFMLQAKPGAFVFLGAGVAPDGTAHALHSPLYDFNDAALPHGVAFWVQLVRQELAGVA
jgi:hippurate hydrolase